MIEFVFKILNNYYLHLTIILLFILIFLLIIMILRKKNNIPLYIIDFDTLKDERFLELFVNNLFAFKIILPQNDFEKFRNFVKELDNKEKDKFLYYLKELEFKKKKGNLKLTKKKFEEIILKKKKKNIIISDKKKKEKLESENIDFVYFPEITRVFHKKIKIGEIIKLKIVKRGRVFDEGIGYIPDGTPVFVKGGAHYLGQEINAKIINFKETYAGLIYEGEIVKEEKFFSPEPP